VGSRFGTDHTECRDLSQQLSGSLPGDTRALYQDAPVQSPKKLEAAAVALAGDSSEDIEKKKQFLESHGIPGDLVEEAKEEDLDIYPDNVQAVHVYVEMLTQWRVGPSGSIGLDYRALETIPAVRRIKDEDEYEDLFSSLQTMERATLKHYREQKDVTSGC